MVSKQGPACSVSLYGTMSIHGPTSFGECSSESPYTSISVPEGSFRFTKGQLASGGCSMQHDTPIGYLLTMRHMQATPCLGYKGLALYHVWFLVRR